MLAEAHSVLAVTSRVDGEIINRRARRTLDGLARDGRLAVLRVNTGEEVLEFWSPMPK